MPGNPQHVPIEEYKANLSKLVSLVRSKTSPYYSPDTKLIMITPPPIIEKVYNDGQEAQLREAGQLGGKILPIRSGDVTEQYAKACYDQAKMEKVPVVDMYTAIIEAAGGDSDEKLLPYFT